MPTASGKPLRIWNLGAATGSTDVRLDSAPLFALSGLVMKFTRIAGYGAILGTGVGRGLVLNGKQIFWRSGHYIATV